MRQRKKAAIFPPRSDIAKGIHANDEEEFLIRLVPAQNLKGVDGIALARSMGFEIGGGESRILGDGGFDHGQALGKRDLFGDGFVRRIGGRNEDNPVKGARLAHLFGYTQMSEVNRIERSA
jgi:hypothetical protein